MALKKRQWHEAHGSQQPDWGKQLCASSEQLGFTGLGTTLAVGGGRSFEGTGTSLGFWKVERTERGRQGGFLWKHHWRAQSQVCALCDGWAASHTFMLH